MRGSTVIIQKELAENFTSKRFITTYILIFLSSVATAFLGFQELAQVGLTKFESDVIFLVLFSGAASPTPSFIFFLSVLASILGIALGFDAVNREIASGSMVRLLSNPIYRDSILVGKIIGGFITIALVIGSIMGITTGVDILLAGFGPTLDGALRIFYFTLATILYAWIWFSMALFFSTVFNRIATSALTSLAAWIFLSFFTGMLASVMAQILIPVTIFSPPEALIAREELRLALSRISPSVLFTEVASALLNPQIRTLGPIYIYSRNLPTPTPLTIDDTLFIIWPHIAAFIAEITIFLTLAYILFMRKEIRTRFE